MSAETTRATAGATRSSERTGGGAPSPGPAGIGRWLRFLGSELGMISGRRRNQVGLLVLAAIPVVVAIAIYVSQPRPGRGPAFLSEITGNGFFVAVTALGIELPLFLPMALAVLSGDAVAGEANAGTLRYLLTVPVDRTRLLITKYVALLVAAVIAPLTVAVAGVISGGIIFGLGPVTTISGDQLGLGEAFGRLALMVLYLAFCLAAVGALGLLVSTLTEQPIAATLTTIGVVTIMLILLQIPQLDWLHPFLFVQEWTAYADLLREPVLLDNIRQGLVVSGCWIVVCLLAAWARFTGKDVTS